MDTDCQISKLRSSWWFLGQSYTPWWRPLVRPHARRHRQVAGEVWTKRACYAWLALAECNIDHLPNGARFSTGLAHGAVDADVTTEVQAGVVWTRGSSTVFILSRCPGPLNDECRCNAKNIYYLGSCESVSRHFPKKASIYEWQPSGVIKHGWLESPWTEWRFRQENNL